MRSLITPSPIGALLPTLERGGPRGRLRSLCRGVVNRRITQHGEAAYPSLRALFAKQSPRAANRDCFPSLRSGQATGKSSRSRNDINTRRKISGSPVLASRSFCVSPPPCLLCSSSMQRSIRAVLPPPGMLPLASRVRRRLPVLHRSGSLLPATVWRLPSPPHRNTHLLHLRLVIGAGDLHLADRLDRSADMLSWIWFSTASIFRLGGSAAAGQRFDHLPQRDQLGCLLRRCGESSVFKL